MIKKIMCFLLLQIYFSKAHLQDNADSSHLPEKGVSKFLDCNARSLSNEKQEPLNSGALKLQSREGEGWLNVLENPVLEPIQTKRPYVYDQDVVENTGKTYLLDTPTKKSNVRNPESYTVVEDSRKEKPKPQNEYITGSNLSDSNVLGKLIENCLTKRLLLAQKAGQLNSEDLLNSRRSNSYDTVEDEDANLEDVKNRNVDEELVDPAEAEGLRRLNHLNKRVPLINHKRVCYACTSASSPNCWQPNRLTTVKYCRSGHDSCTTKTYQAGSQLVVVRDCGDTCASALGIDPVYKSCSICQSDFCNTNGANSVTSLGLICLFIMSVAKTVL